jgi:lysophospholipase L1-like esterase
MNNEILLDLLYEWSQDKKNGKTVVAFGSSNTALAYSNQGQFNWVSWLSCALRKDVGHHIAVVNQGIGGDTAVGLLERFERDVTRLKPDMVIITIGGNDAKKVTLEEYQEDMVKLIAKTQEIGAQPVLQTYYCPLYNKMPKNYPIFEKFVQINRDLSKERNIPLIDQYQIFSPYYYKDRKNYEQIMRDGLHVNGIGNAIMAIILCRSFGLGDPKITFLKKEIKFHVKQMKKYSRFP